MLIISRSQTTSLLRASDVRGHREQEDSKNMFLVVSFLSTKPELFPRSTNISAKCYHNHLYSAHVDRKKGEKMKIPDGGANSVMYYQRQPFLRRDTQSLEVPIPTCRNF